MKVLGLVGSARKLGNSDILVREALAEASQEGAGTQLIYLAEKKIDGCQGCMSCVFRGTPCHLKDDVAWLLEQFWEADGLIVGAPTYVLGPAGPIKLLIDRFLMIGLELEKWWAKPRYGGVISVAGLRDWNPFGLSLLNLLLMVYQFEPIGGVKAVRPGPAEVLLDEETLRGARELGQAVVRALEGARSGIQAEEELGSGLYWRRGQERADRDGSSGLICPVCGSESFEPEVLKGRLELKCPICGVRGWVEPSSEPATGSAIPANPGFLTAGREGWPTQDSRGATTTFQVTFAPETIAHSRWSHAALLDHVHNWILATRGIYLANRPRVKPLLARYRS